MIALRIEPPNSAPIYALDFFNGRAHIANTDAQARWLAQRMVWAGIDDAPWCVEGMIEEPSGTSFYAFGGARASDLAVAERRRRERGAVA